MLARTAFRALVVQQLLATDTAAKQNVFENRALPLTPEQLPAICVSTPADHKQSLLRGGPQFTSTFALQLDVRVTAATDGLSLAALEALLVQIEAATLSNQVIIDQVQQFPTVRTDQRVSTDGKYVLADASMQIECEIYEDYRFPPSAPLTSIAATVTNPAGDEMLTFDAAPPQ